jgi:chromate transporter
LAIVVQAVLRISKRALKNNVMIGIAALAFLAIFLFRVPFPIIVASAALIGFLGGRAGLKEFQVGGGHGKAAGYILQDRDSAMGEATPLHAQPNLRWSLKISSIVLALWLVPVLLLVWILGRENVFSEIAVFFSQMAVVTFGGAYAVLAYVAQEAVQNYGWVTPGEMLDGLGMAETTPGPLIQVVQFVGFMGAFRDSGSLNPYVAATLASVLVTWVTFVPCFLWIFLGAPFIEKLRDNKAMTGALSAITAAVVGVILNLAIWFAIHVVFARVSPWSGAGMTVDLPDLTSVNWAALVLVTAAMVAIFRFKASAFLTLALAAIAGIGWSFVAA